MKTLRILICAVLAHAAIIQAYGKKTETTTDYLMKYKWKVETVLGGGETGYLSFDRTKVENATVYDKNDEEYDPKDGDGRTMSSRYYISDTIDSTFRNSEVGKSKTGSYIVVQAPKKGEPNVYIIMSAEAGRLVLFSHNRSGVYMGGGKPITYIGLPKEKK